MLPQDEVRVNPSFRGVRPIVKSKANLCISLEEIHKSKSEIHTSLEEIHISLSEMCISSSDLHKRMRKVRK